jgi:hypothetical protein
MAMSRSALSHIQQQNREDKIVMSLDMILALAALICASIPTLMFFHNLTLFRQHMPTGDLSTLGNDADLEPVSVLIPARNEENTIEDAVRAVLASRGVELELVVLDDGSQDATYERMQRLVAEDSRVRLARGKPLPPDWCGKQHACATLAELAHHPILVFIDADVRLTPEALAYAVRLLKNSRAAMISGFPHQVTVTWLERLLIPLIHFVLLGFLPMGAMRRSSKPGYGAGCGQFVLVWQEAYHQVGGHAAVRTSLHDGIQLPRAFRRAGLHTDLFDASAYASCRMYHNAREVWQGLGKNAIEGMAAPGVIGPMTLLLVMGQIAPLVLLVAGLAGVLSLAATSVALVASLLVYIPPLIMVRRFRQPLDSALLHPLGILLLLVIQWQALIRWLRGRPSSWKGRSYPLTAKR